MKSKNTGVAFVTIALLGSLSTLCGAMPARAENTNGTPIVRAATLPNTVAPVMIRVAMMLQASRSRLAGGGLPSGARSSYANAQSALTQALVTGRLSLDILNIDKTNSAGLPVSSAQVGSDIRALRAAARTATLSQANALNQIASLYANGAKEYFTGELRIALFSAGDPSANIVIRNYQPHTDTVSSAILPASPTVTTVDQTTVKQPAPAAVAAPPVISPYPILSLGGLDLYPINIDGANPFVLSSPYSNIPQVIFPGQSVIIGGPFGTP